MIETGGKRVLLDPGIYSHGQNFAKMLDLVLITHEHQDHLHLESLRVILENNPGVKIVSVPAVKKLLESERIDSETLAAGRITKLGSVAIEAFGGKHAEIYKTLPQVENVGFMIDNKFYFPGDSFASPGKPADILALPFAGPWMKISEAIDFAQAVKPKICFPVHDGNLKSLGAARNLVNRILKENNIAFHVVEDNTCFEF